MITSTIGKIFLEAYNKKYSTNYDAKTFFVEVYYPLFFDDNKYLMTAGNTPFENGPKIGWAKMITGKIPFETLEERKTRYDKFLEKISLGYPTTDNAIAYASADIVSTTSGQSTNIKYPFLEEEIYLSWIGAGLNVRTSGLLILFFDEQILLDIFEGWKFYREMLANYKLLKGNQIETWNSHWLSFKYSKECMELLFPTISKNIEPCKGLYVGCNQIMSHSWTKLLIAISKYFPDSKMMGYVYDLGQTNTSIGFIPFCLDHIRKAINLYTKFFGAEESAKAEPIWGTENGFRVCCQKGAIGVEAMQPKGLKPYMTAEKGEIKFPKYREGDEEQKISFNTYQIWLLAMLNNQELWDMSHEFAKALQTYVKKDKNLSTKRSNWVKDILSATSKKAFISSLSEIASDIESFDIIEKNAKEVNAMPTDNVPYFLTLIRFHYAGLDNKNNQHTNV
ncbi:MAG: hypothetical protein IKK68_06750 [Paludibacteraceae bacterium]|nr:hypothetical protein [Paludibacteraceae bacterium]